MRPNSASKAFLPLLLAGAMAWPLGAGAQTFSADYALTRAGALTGEPDARVSPAPLQLGAVRFGPTLQADGKFSGAGLSVDVGRNWFGQVGVGRSLQPNPNMPGGSASEDVLRVGGGYRWSDGQALSLQLSRIRGADRLGLSVGYDWPRYFVRLSYDPGLNLTPADVLRFSAGLRF